MKKLLVIFSIFLFHNFLYAVNFDEVKIEMGYYLSGNLKSKCQVVNNKREGICIFYFDSKNKEESQRINYKDNKLHGYRYVFLKNGYKILELKYEYNTLYFGQCGNGLRLSRGDLVDFNEGGVIPDKCYN